MKTARYLTRLFQFLGVLLVLELVVRLTFPPAYPRAEFGWGPSGPQTLTRVVSDAPDVRRTVQIQLGPNGFRRWGHLDSDQEKLFVIGGTQTYAPGVSNGEEWYAFMPQALSGSVDLFVFGGVGYSTLQQFMVLDSQLDSINPDTVLWEVCSRDYWMNDYEHDRLLYPGNWFGSRPYLENGNIRFRMPLPGADVRRVSRIADRTLSVYDKRAKAELRALRADSENEQLAQREDSIPDAVRQRARDTTAGVFAAARVRLGDTPVMLFNACGPLGAFEKRVCAENGFHCIGGVYEAVQEVEARGVSVRIVKRRAWNIAGNAVAGLFLAEAIRDRQEVELEKAGE